LIGLVCLAAVAAGFACGSGGDDDDLSGEAALAVAQFWQQEASAGTLPEGVSVTEGRTAPNGVIELDAGDEDARFCVVFNYVRAAPPFDTLTRSYLAVRNGDETWSVTVVNPAGDCEGIA
jgi:hypothetical protein